MSLRFTEEEYAKLLDRNKVLAVSKSSKYRNQKVVIDGITFDSKKEGEKYRQLKQLEQANEITELTLQPVFVLAPAVVLNGRKKQALKYIADFQYKENGKTIIMDVKGMLTDVYKIKRHLMKSLHDIDILEA